MKLSMLLTIAAPLLIMAGTGLQAAPVTAAELSESRAWSSAKFAGKTAVGDLPVMVGPFRQPADTQPPFSFVYQGRPSAEWFAKWPVRRQTQKLDAQRTQRTLTYKDPETGLTARCVAVEYHDYPTVEWTVYFKNTGAATSGILSDIHAVEMRLQRSGNREFILHHQKGTFVRADDFEPLTTRLEPGRHERFAPPAGRPLGAVFPYYNIQLNEEDVIVVIGWPGQWYAEFNRDVGNGLQITGGQEQTRLVLHPGEEIRTPLVVCQFGKGDWLRAQNVWRRWMLAHNVPRVDGRLSLPLLASCSSHQFGEMIHANEESQTFFIDRYIQEGLKPDYWWMDAGWYVNSNGWPNTGTWEVDSNRFPHGLRAITDHAHSKGVKSLVWFEPERVTAGTWLAVHHPEWLLKGTLLNLGDPAARDWLTDHIDKLLTEQGIDLYRQDYNIDPLSFWRDNDGPDRQGITENHYVTGYLAYWDELRRRHPHMLIDSCASGGHRNDLETMRRALPFWRSDYIQDAVGSQGQTYGLSFWLPYHGTGTDQTGEYDLISAMDGPLFNALWDMRDRTLNYDLLRRLVANWRGFADNYLGDYYPLTPYSLAPEAWMAWQFDQPDKGKGMVQVFRHDQSSSAATHFKLQGLEAKARYTVVNLAEPAVNQEFDGRELMDSGIPVVVPNPRAAAVLLYQRKFRLQSAK